MPPAQRKKMSNLGNPFENFPRMPSRSGMCFDFVSDEELVAFVNTAVTTGTAAVRDDIQHGALRISGAATTDDSGASLQVDAESLALKADKITRYLARVRLGETTSTNVDVQSEFIAGLCVHDTTGTPPLGAGMTDGIYFRKSDGAATIDCVVERDSVESVLAAVATLAKDVWYDLAIEVIMSSTAGTGEAIFKINGTEVGRIKSTTMPYEAEEILSPSVEFISGDATGTKFLDVDFLAADQQR